MTSKTTIARLAALVIAAACLPPGPSAAQDDAMTPIATPAQADAIMLDTGPLPGATTPEAWHRQYGSAFARNVTVATLTPYLADPDKASGAAVIVAPEAASARCRWRTRAPRSPRRSLRAACPPSCSSTASTRRRAIWPSSSARCRRCSRALRPSARDFARRHGRDPRPADRRCARGLRAHPRARRRMEGRSRPHRHGRFLRRRDADDGHRARWPGCPPRLYRQYLRSAGDRTRANRRAAPVRRAGRRRPAVPQRRLRADRKLAGSRGGRSNSTISSRAGTASACIRRRPPAPAGSTLSCVGSACTGCSRPLASATAGLQALALERPVGASAETAVLADERARGDLVPLELPFEPVDRDVRHGPAHRLRKSTP